MTAPTEQPGIGARRPRSRWAPAMIFALFLLPMVAAYMAFKFFPDTFRELAKSNHGEFIHPPRPLPMDVLMDANGDPVRDTLAGERWSLVYADSSDCDEVCRSRLYQMRQVWMTQGKDIDRVQRLLILTDRDHWEELRPHLQEHFPRMQVAFLRPRAAPALAEAMAAEGGARDALTSQRLYVADPLGRLMMYYPAPEDEQLLRDTDGIRKDVAKLLHNSKLR